MSQHNISTNHPIIPNANNYMYEQRYVSIHSNDRDLIKYPKSSDFEIELPQDYQNVISTRLHSWTMPSNYNVFSLENYNVIMTFKLLNLYNPGTNIFKDASYQAVSEAFYAALSYNQDKNYAPIIEQGFYNPEQMAIELTNKFNDVINNTIYNFLQSPEGASYTIAKEIYDNQYTNSKYKKYVLHFQTIDGQVHAQ